MSSRNMELFRRALIEASCNVYDRELAECTEDAKCSRRHYAKMRKILGVTILPATSRKMQIKRRVLAALIAAVMLLTGCTAYAYREDIKDFIETVLDDYIRVSYNDGEKPASSATISEYYTLGYVPEGYELVKCLEQSYRNREEWENSAGDYIVFVQYCIENALLGLDTESEDWELVKVGDHEVYCRCVGINYYIWNDGKYAYQLTLSTELPDQEMISIIEGLKIKE